MAEAKKNGAAAQDTQPPSYWPVVVAVTGLFFGFVFEKSRVYEPSVIVNQMLFREFAMLKMFFCAVAGSMVSLACISYLRPKAFARVRRGWGCAADSLPLFRSALPGAFLLGSGMTLSGACPGMVLVQIGAGVSTSWATWLGCMAGAAANHLVPFFSCSEWFSEGYKLPFKFVDERLRMGYAKIAVPMGLMMAVMAGLLELIASWDTELRTNKAGCSGFDCLLWPPQVSGICIGLCQLPLVLGRFNTLGTSSQYRWLTAQPIALVGRRTQMKLNNPFLGSDWWWQVLLGACTVLGAFISASSSDSYALVQGLPLWRAFVGGFLMLFGASSICGCTSGHGISGFALLVGVSGLIVGAMFAGGIATAFALLAAGV